MNRFYFLGQKTLFILLIVSCVLFAGCGSSGSGDGQNPLTGDVDGEFDPVVDGMLEDSINGYVLHVPADYPTIQAAIDAAVDGDTVLVAPGTYTGEGNRDLEILWKDIDLISSQGAKVTIIDCQASESDPHQGLYVAGLPGDHDPIIEGFTFRNGYLDVDGALGGAIQTFQVRPTIRNCVFENNFSQAGGAIKTDRGTVIENCLFFNNSASYGGGAFYSIYAGYSTTIMNSAFYNNYTSQEPGDGGAIWLRDVANTTSYFVTNNLFVGNRARGEGGAIFCKGDHTQYHFTNNTIVENYAIGGASGIRLPSFSVSENTITNCIIRNGGLSEIIYFGENQPLITFNNIQGGWEGEGNIDADPLFMLEALRHPYRLKPFSPCIDAANGDVAPAWDILGRARFDDPYVSNTGIGIPNFVEMGAYERIVPSGPSISVRK